MLRLGVVSSRTGFPCTDVRGIMCDEFCEKGEDFHVGIVGGDSCIQPFKFARKSTRTSRAELDQLKSKQT